MTPRENDIYRWSWKNGEAPITGCYAHKAIFINGGLRDIFWYDWKTRSSINLDRIEMRLLGNIEESREIKVWDLPYYDPADIVDLRHSNNSNAPIYLKLSATKSQEWMLAHAEQKESEARGAKERAERNIAEWSEKVAKIAAGDLEVFL